MDDFGTCYSSLSYLRAFPFDKIKIDRSFVSGIEVDTRDLAIIQAVATLGAGFNIVTTAEGVETAQQLERLKTNVSVKCRAISPGGQCVLAMCTPSSGTAAALAWLARIIHLLSDHHTEGA